MYKCNSWHNGVSIWLWPVRKIITWIMHKYCKFVFSLFTELYASFKQLNLYDSSALPSYGHRTNTGCYYLCMHLLVSPLHRHKIIGFLDAKPSSSNVSLNEQVQKGPHIYSGKEMAFQTGQNFKTHTNQCFAVLILKQAFANINIFIAID